MQIVLDFYKLHATPNSELVNFFYFLLNFIVSKKGIQCQGHEANQSYMVSSIQLSP